MYLLISDFYAASLPQVPYQPEYYYNTRPKIRPKEIPSDNLAPNPQSWERFDSLRQASLLLQYLELSQMFYPF